MFSRDFVEIRYSRSKNKTRKKPLRWFEEISFLVSPDFILSCQNNLGFDAVVFCLLACLPVCCSLQHENFRKKKGIKFIWKYFSFKINAVEKRNSK